MTSAVGALSSFGWSSAMGLALAGISLLALAFVAFYPKQELSLVADRERVRGFKGDTLEVALKIGSRTGLSRVHLALTGVPKGVDASLKEVGEGHVLTVRSPFAGPFSKFNLEISVGDPMGIFARKETRQLDLTFEFLPSFLLAAHRLVRVSPLVTGDRPAGKRGFGQEFYSAEISNSPHSSRDVLWNRQARSTTDDLMVRVGESNLPENLTIGLIEPNSFAQRQNPRWVDLASEAVASFGSPVVTAGSSLRVVHAVEEKLAVLEARNEKELADLIMQLWGEDIAKQKSGAQLDQSDIIMVAQSDTSLPRIINLLQRKPAVILSWTPRQSAPGSKVAFFSGHEDLSWLVTRMAAR